MYSYANASEFLKSNHDFPYKKVYFTKKKIQSMFDKLKKTSFEDRVRNKFYRIKSLDYSPVELLYKGRPTLLIHKDKDYCDFNILSDMFQEENRMKCKMFKEKLSPEKYYKKHIKEIADYCIKKYKRITPHTMRESLYAHVKECTSFRPLNLTFIIQLFGSKSILDFSSGWGDRLIAAMAAEVKYTGVDPNYLLHPKYAEMIQFFAKDKSKYKMIEGRIQDVKLNTKVDLVFTSPPYFKFEDYGVDIEDTEDEWYEKFLKVAINKSISCLKIGGYLVLVINQKRGETYIKNMCNYINSLPKMYPYGVISYTKESYSNPQPMWIWCKASNVPEELYNPPVVITTHEFKNAKLNKDIKFKVFRDDMLIGGTKQRAFIPLLEKSNKKEFVYAGPNTGYAQVALAYAAHLTKKKGTMFLSNYGKRTAITRYALTFGLNLKEQKFTKLKELQERASKYVNENSQRHYIKMSHTEDYVKILTENLKKAMPKVNPSDGTRVNPRRIWLVAGSAGVLNALYKIFPNAEFMVVQVGKKIWPDQIESARTTLFISKEPYSKVAKKQPPYLTVRTYDAKLWTFFMRHGKEGDYIWNVAKDIRI
jgi:hypothetical protein